MTQKSSTSPRNLSPLNQTLAQLGLAALALTLSQSAQAREYNRTYKQDHVRCEISGTIESPTETAQPLGAPLYLEVKQTSHFSRWGVFKGTLGLQRTRDIETQVTLTDAQGAQLDAPALLGDIRLSTSEDPASALQSHQEGELQFSKQSAESAQKLLERLGYQEGEFISASNRKNGLELASVRFDQDVSFRHKTHEVIGEAKDQGPESWRSTPSDTVKIRVKSKTELILNGIWEYEIEIDNPNKRGYHGATLTRPLGIAKGGKGRTQIHHKMSAGGASIHINVECDKITQVSDKQEDWMTPDFDAHLLNRDKEESAFIPSARRLAQKAESSN
jgi:hypothetical protein